MSSESDGNSGSAHIKAPQRFIAGIVLICIFAFVFWAVSHLPQGTLKFMGPAMFPRVLASMLGISGVILIVLSLLHEGEPLQKWSYRGPITVTVAILLFALTVRDFGLIVASFLALFFSGFATPEAKPREILIFAIVMTAACVLLFRYLLGMVVPVLIIPGTNIDL